MTAKYLLAIALAIAGLLLIGCGTTVCWLRFGRNRGKTVEEIRREEGGDPLEK